jgi:MFS family permease
VLRKFFSESGISIKYFSIIFVLLVNALTWFFMFPTVIDGILEGIVVTDAQKVLIWSAYYGGIVISTIIGSIIANKVDRFKFIYTWIVIGIATSIIPIIYASTTWLDCLIISILLSSSFGLGIPSCLSYFADITHIENRGKVGGIILLTIFIATSILAILFKEIYYPANLVAFAGWRSLGLSIFLLKPNETNTSLQRKMDTSLFSEIRQNKNFWFYIFAWIMFNMVDVLAGPIVVESMGDISTISKFANPIIAGITALIAGIAADKIGRKKIVLYGFISLGIAYALFGIAPNEPFAGYFFVGINGITIGLFFLTFILILWGDISQSGLREKYYALGILPFFLTSIIGILSEGVIPNEDTRIFSIAAFFLFLAVLPLLVVLDTLPEKKIELIRLRSFADDAKKMREKFEKKR